MTVQTWGVVKAVKAQYVHPHYPKEANSLKKVGQVVVQMNLQLEGKVFNPPDIFPLISIVNKSCNIERCVNTILPIIQNLIVS